MNNYDKPFIWLIDQLKLTVKNRETIDNLSAIYIGENKDTTIKRYLVEKMVMISVVVAVLVLLLTLSVATDKKVLQDGNILRPERGEADKEIYLEATVNDSKVPVVFTLEEAQLKHSELYELLSKVDMDLLQLMLKGNEDREHVRSNLNLVRNIPNTKVTVKWESNNPLIIDYMGNVSNKDIDPKGVEVVLYASLHYKGYEIEKEYIVKVLPPIVTREEKLRQDLIESIRRQSDIDQYKDRVTLPKQIGGTDIQWTEHSSNKLFSIAFVFALILVAAIKGKDFQLREKVKARNQQMQVDYSDIVTKLSLLISAGLTTGAAIQKLVADYTKTKEKKHNRKRYAYEELVFSCSGLANGMTEQEVLEKYGLSCKLQEYIMLTSILNQNIKRGTAQLSQTLDELTKEAYMNKKAIAKILGEKASTKLLLPMMLCLIIVLMIIVIPTILSIQI